MVGGGAQLTPPRGGSPRRASGYFRFRPITTMTMQTTRPTRGTPGNRCQFVLESLAAISGAIANCWSATDTASAVVRSPDAVAMNSSNAVFPLVKDTMYSESATPDAVVCVSNPEALGMPATANCVLPAWLCSWPSKLFTKEFSSDEYLNWNAVTTTASPSLGW